MGLGAESRVSPGFFHQWTEAPPDHRQFATV